MNLEPCPVCGGSASLDWGSVTDCYGKSWQGCAVWCNEDKASKDCWVRIDVTVDANAPQFGSTVERILTETWNELSEQCRNTA